MFVVVQVFLSSCSKVTSSIVSIRCLTCCVSAMHRRRHSGSCMATGTRALGDLPPSRPTTITRLMTLSRLPPGDCMPSESSSPGAPSLHAYNATLPGLISLSKDFYFISVLVVHHATCFEYHAIVKVVGTDCADLAPCIVVGSEMCSLTSQLLLHLNTSHLGVFHNAEAECLALCHLASLHSQQVRSCRLTRRCRLSCHADLSQLSRESSF